MLESRRISHLNDHLVRAGQFQFRCEWMKGHNDSSVGSSFPFLIVPLKYLREVQNIHNIHIHSHILRVCSFKFNRFYLRTTKFVRFQFSSLSLSLLAMAICKGILSCEEKIQGQLKQKYGKQNKTKHTWQLCHKVKIKREKYQDTPGSSLIYQNAPRSSKITKLPLCPKKYTL